MWKCKPTTTHQEVFWCCCMDELPVCCVSQMVMENHVVSLQVMMCESISDQTVH